MHTMKQIGFLIDSRRCIQCHACQTACKATHNVELGVQLRQVLFRWEGEFPAVTHPTISISCMHCVKPSCLDVCRSAAISKREEDGAIVVDQKKCTGCRRCQRACPYDAPQFGTNKKMQKCDLCVERRQVGLDPACVATCPTEALVIGEMDQLQTLAQQRGGVKLQGETNPSAYIVLASGKDSIDSFLLKARGTSNCFSAEVTGGADHADC